MADGPRNRFRVALACAVLALAGGCRTVDEAATVELEDRYYRVTGAEERREGAWISVVYRLREQDPTSAIRRLVRYRPPAAGGDPVRPHENGSAGRKTP